MTDPDTIIDELESLEPVHHAYEYSNRIRVSIQGGRTGMAPCTEQVVALYDALGIHGELGATQDHFIEIDYPTDELADAIDDD